MSDPVCIACKNKGLPKWCPLCGRSSTPRLQFDKKMLDDVHAAHTAPPDDLDNFWEALAAMDGKRLSEAQDRLIENGTTYSFLALCVRLLPVIILLVLAGWGLVSVFQGGTT